MEDLSTVFVAVKQLISKTAEQDSSNATAALVLTSSPLVRRLQSNLTSYYNIFTDTRYKELSKQLSQFRKQLLDGCVSIEDDSIVSTPFSVYLEFAREGMCLLSLLDATLCTLDKKDEEERIHASSIHPPPAPRALISISDIKSVHSLVQFVISLGIYPYLLPAVDGSLRLRLAHAKSVEKVNQLSNSQRSFLLHNCTKVLSSIFENPVIGPSVVSQHFPDLLAALIQVCYAPSTSIHSQTSRATDATYKHGTKKCLLDEQETHGLSVDSASRSLTSPGEIGGRSSPTPHHQSSSIVDSCTISSTLSSSTIPLDEITPTQRDWCMETLQKLLRNTYQPLVIRELLTLQSLSSRQVPTSRAKQTGQVGRQKQVGRGVPRGRWLRKVCGQLLSERLMDKNGVLNVLKGIFDTTAATVDSWKKCQAVAKVIASCPSQATSVEDYCSLVCPQVLALLHDSQESVDGVFTRVAIATMTEMMSEQKNLSMKYLIKPLVKPLLLISGDAPGNFDPLVLGRSLVACIEDLHKVCTIVESSSPLLISLLPYLALLFCIWLAGRDCATDRKASLQSKEILSTVVKSSDPTSVLTFLCHVSQFKPSSTSCPSLPEGEYLSLNPTLTLFYSTVDKEQVLTVKTLTEKEAMDRHSVQEMEKVGDGVTTFLSLELKHDNVLGLFFIHCMQHLASVISTQTGINVSNSGSNDPTIPSYRSKGNETNSSPSTSLSPNSTRTEEHGESQTASSVGNSTMPPTLKTRSTSSILLECESKLPPSCSEAYSNSLVLYITASICESLSSSLLEQTELPDLLSTLFVVISCHAHCVTRSEKRTTKADSMLVNEESQLDEILGGPITLSIAFGLLSAIMGGAIEVERCQRPLFTQLQPFLLTIATSYPVEELSALANDLNVCIATLGAVWKSEMKEKVAASYSGPKKTLAEKKNKHADSNKESSLISSHDKPSNHSMNDQPSSTGIHSPAVEGHLMQLSFKKTVDDVSLEREGKKSATKGVETNKDRATPFQQAMEDVRDHLVPVKGHGLISLSKLIQSRDESILSESQLLHTVFREHLNHPDSYVYLASINGLVSLASIPEIRGSVISSLCQGYALLPGPPSHVAGSPIDLETGQLKSKRPASLEKNREEAEVKKTGNVKLPSVCCEDEYLKSNRSNVSSTNPTGLRTFANRVETASLQTQHSVEVRMKLGEALVKVARTCGELLPQYLDEILASIFSNMKDPDPFIRASSLSNLADVCASVKFSFGQIQNEVLSCVTNVLQTESEVKVRQAALVVIKLTIKGLSHDTIQVLGDSLREIYRLLKHVESCDKDELTRVHAQAVLGELDKVMRNYIFPERSKELSKKISILEI